MNDFEKARAFAALAVKYEQIGDNSKAVECYFSAALFLDRFIGSNAENLPAIKAKKLNEKVLSYRNRASTLKENEGLGHQSENERAVQQCYFLFQQALDADEAELKDLAVELYSQAVETAVSVKSVETNVKNRLTLMAQQALDRAEMLKNIDKVTKLNLKSPQIQGPQKAKLTREASLQLKLTSEKHNYTEEEKLVLHHTSKINNNYFFPFMDIDLKEKFQYAIPFQDKDGLLKLSSKQAAEFSRWVRPDEICPEPKMISGEHIDFFSIKQTIVSDCSFVASLAVSALYEKRFNKKLITSIIYPKNKNKEPIVNPFGKYMVKLHLNGVRRKIIIDELLPYSKYARLLCSYSNNKNEFWVSLLEKAYMKVMGGYDFPGSNSNIDLHALTGWIPERFALRPNDPDFNSTALFETVKTRLERGDVLATVATGNLSDAQAERTGLVATHAYALIDVKVVNGVRLLKLKNPWSHLRWRGNYSELDTTHWTESLKKELNYDPESAALYDNGIFWIDYESILHFFDVFYLNWNPALFKYTNCIHQKWEAGSGPIKDAYNIGENPQFSLKLQGQGAVWMLLTRHITDISDFRDNQEYITLLVYKNEGKRVYYPHDPPPHIDGVRINSPHYLCKILVGNGSADKYTLVVSQYEKMRSIYYTLRAYGTCPFNLEKLEPYPFSKTVCGEWKGISAGGCENYPTTYPNNPSYTLTLPNSGDIHLALKGPKEYQMGIDMRVISLDDPSLTAPFIKKSSGPYRSGFVVLELSGLPAGKYKVVVSTFYQAQEGPFIFEVKSRTEVSILPNS